MFRSILFFLLLSINLTAQVPKDFSLLAQQIDSIIKADNVPGAQLVITNRDSILWRGNFGYADLVNEQPITNETMLRIGSVSKSFTAMSVMQLVEKGKLKLTDKVRDLAPELPFTNSWAETDPITVAHLLEHTTGFDDMRMVEYATSGDGWTTLEGMEFYPESKNSRWRPGTHTSYCNSGPPMAAYIVEKITGQTIEDYIRTNIFQPLGMRNATHFKNEYVNQHLANGYTGPDNNETDYWHLIGRASGSINATGTEMANYVQLLLNNGQLNDSTSIITPESLIRMETPKTTLAAKRGELNGYGLNLACSDYRGVRVCGHNGGMEGFLTNMRYIPEKNIGYILMINKRSGLGPLVEATLNFLIDPNDEWEMPLADNQDVNADFLGYYRTATSRNEFLRFLEWFLNVAWIEQIDDTLYFQSLLGEPDQLSVANDFTLNRQLSNGKVSPLVLSEDSEGRTILQSTATLENFYKTSSFAVYGFFVLSGIAILVMLSFLLYPFFWLIRRLITKKPGFKRFYWWPISASLAFLVTLLAILRGLDAPDILNVLGNPTPISMTIFAGSLAFSILALLTFFIGFFVWQKKVQQRSKIYYFLGALSIIFVFGYFYYFGALGIRTWA
ncbi:MAG: serine hydrolase domain-containing protein [Bacteroidota bacterium]